MLSIFSNAQISITYNDTTDIIAFFDSKIDSVYFVFGEPDHIEREKVTQHFGEDTRGSDEALYYKKYDMAFLTLKHFDYAGYLETRHWIHKLYYNDCYVNSMVIKPSTPLTINANSFSIIKDKQSFLEFFNKEEIKMDDTFCVIHQQFSEYINLEFRFFFDKEDQFQKLIITEDL